LIARFPFKLREKIMKCLSAMTVFGAFALMAPHSALAAVVGFDSGNEGWFGPEGPGGSSGIENVGGNPGNHLHTVFNNFGIEFSNSTNASFLGDYTQYGSVTLSIDVRTESIQFFGQPVARDLIVDLRSFSLAQGGYPWASTWYTMTTMESGEDWATYSVTISNPSSATLPAGWGGSGAEDPTTFEPMLPTGVTFADVLADVDEISFSTYVPGFFYGFTDFDIRVDNIRIETTPIPAPGALALLGIASLRGRRRR